jgi:hypothetical protein
VTEASDLSRGLTTTLRIIVELILPAYPPLDAPTCTTVHEHVTRYVASQIQSMPGFLRLPYKLAFVVFDWLPLLRYGRPFRRLPGATQTAYLALWNDGPIAPMRDFVKLIRSSALLVYFDHPLVMEKLEAERRGSATSAQEVANG